MDVAAGAVALMFGIFVLNRLMNITVLRSTVHKKGRIFPALCDDLICPKSYAGIWVEYETNEFVNGLFVVDYRRSTETIRPLEKVTLKVGAF